LNNKPFLPQIIVKVWSQSLGKRLKILIFGTGLESIEDIRLVLNQYQPDWQLFVIDSVEECLNIIKGINSPDAIILEIQLSGISSFDLISCIRDDSDIPIIALSDEKDVNTLVKAFEAGVSDYIVAPFSKAVFIARIKAQIRRKEWDIHAEENGFEFKISNNFVGESK
jgi:DNA-binding response OmpR family regulator